MAPLSENTIREMKKTLVRARKSLEQHDEELAEIRRMREEQEQRILNKNYQPQ